VYGESQVIWKLCPLLLFKTMTSYEMCISYSIQIHIIQACSKICQLNGQISSSKWQQFCLKTIFNMATVGPLLIGLSKVYTHTSKNKLCLIYFSITYTFAITIGNYQKLQSSSPTIYRYLYHLHIWPPILSLFITYYFFEV
jgi:hypothetical protein